VQGFLFASIVLRTDLRGKRLHSLAETAI